METIFAPWRMAYIRGEKAAGCILCRDSCRDEELVVCEGKSAFVMMNRYPYTGGHLMIVPYRHICRLGDLTPEEGLELFALQDLSVRVLTEAMKPDGIQPRHRTWERRRGRGSMIISMSTLFPGGSATPTS